MHFNEQSSPQGHIDVYRLPSRQAGITRVVVGSFGGMLLATMLDAPIEPTIATITVSAAVIAGLSSLWSP